MDKLQNAVFQAVNAAVEEREEQSGRYYRSALEGYGDLAKELLTLQAGTKDVKKAVADVVDWVSAQEPDELARRLLTVEAKTNAMVYGAIRMCAAARRFGMTVRRDTGGDLPDLLEGEGEEQ